jgi:hypothetical protein
MKPQSIRTTADMPLHLVPKKTFCPNHVALRSPHLHTLHLPWIPEHVLSLCLVEADGEELAASLTLTQVRQKTSKLSLVMNLFFRMTCMILHDHKDDHNVTGSCFCQWLLTARQKLRQTETVCCTVRQEKRLRVKLYGYKYAATNQKATTWKRNSVNIQSKGANRTPYAASATNSIASSRMLLPATVSLLNLMSLGSGIAVAKPGGTLLAHLGKAKQSPKRNRVSCTAKIKLL